MCPTDFAWFHYCCRGVQGCELHSVPRQLATATALLRLRIIYQGDVLQFSAEDIELFSLLPRLTYVNVAKVWSRLSTSSPLKCRDALH